MHVGARLLGCGCSISRHHQQSSKLAPDAFRSRESRKESEEEETLLGRFTKLDLSPSEISPGDPGTLGESSMAGEGSHEQSFRSALHVAFVSNASTA